MTTIATAIVITAVVMRTSANIPSILSPIATVMTGTVIVVNGVSLDMKREPIDRDDIRLNGKDGNIAVVIDEGHALRMPHAI